MGDCRSSGLRDIEWQDRAHLGRSPELGRVIEAMWESPKLPDGSYNWHRSDDCDELFDLIMPCLPCRLTA